MSSVRAQATQLLCALVYHALVAAFSFPWHLFRCIAGLNCSVASNMKTATFWEGEVYHVRRKPAHHQFKCAPHVVDVSRLIANAVLAPMHYPGGTAVNRLNV